MSTLKVNKLRDTAGSADAIVLDPNGGAVLAGVTTVTSVKVGAAVTISESGIEASGIGITCANLNGGQIGGRRNIIINGDMRIAQRGTSSTSNGYYTVDRFRTSVGGTDEALTQAQVDLSSSDTPYSLGFRKAFKLTNGNQTSGAGDGDYVIFQYKAEAQDIANSGWNYTDSNSKLTIQFWAKSSVAKTFILSLYTQDGTDYAYNHKYALAANTWTKITHTFPGNSNLTFDNDNGLGIQFQWLMWSGATYTSGSTVDQWVPYGGYTSTPDDTDDWYVENDATWEITGIQLEVGSQATAFEHRSMGDELLLCQRYYFKLGKQDYLGTHMAAGEIYGIGMSDNDNENIYGMINFPVRMRQPPTAIDQSGSASDYRVRRDTSKTCTGVPTFVDAAEHYCRVNFPSSSHGWGTGQMLWCQSAGSSGYLGFSAELS